MAEDPDRFEDMEGGTDSEMLLYLALTFGLEDDPRTAVARAVGVVEESARRHNIGFPMQGTIATTDGATTWAFRYSSEGRSRSLFHSTDVATLRHQYPDMPELHLLSDDARLVVSEPLRDLRGAWREVPEASCVEIRGGEEKITPFKPLVPAGLEGTWAPVREAGRIAWYFNGDYPWLGRLFCAPIIGLWYWCTDQDPLKPPVVQRSAAVRRPRHDARVRSAVAGAGGSPITWGTAPATVETDRPRTASALSTLADPARATTP